ncbi:Mo25-like protein [Dioscorea alata]|uniref:Mo25-like protein n=1 Tax=Dioscorea alata TaxID=55571 RepID=A0ACB7V1A0_DIOAL|nr:Mo25-like protein [Dioscorea alata]
MDELEIDSHLLYFKCEFLDYNCVSAASLCHLILWQMSIDFAYAYILLYILESTSFELFFTYVELPNFDIASDALATFKISYGFPDLFDLLTRHENSVSQFLSSHFEQFFDRYEKLLTSANYMTRRQSLKFLPYLLLDSPNTQIMKRYILEVRYLNLMMELLQDSSKNIQRSAFHVFKVFVANPNKPQEVIDILLKNRDILVTRLSNLPTSKGGEDEQQLEEERDLIIQEIESMSLSPNSIS